MKNIVAIFIFCLWSVSLVVAQPMKDKEPPKPTTRILIILDASLSMSGKWQSDIKMNVAKKLLNELIDSLQTVDNLQLALRVYGHQKPYPPQDCNDFKLEVPFSAHNYDKIKQKLRVITPSGTTPIAMTLEASANDFPECTNCRNIIILITDGLEECSGDPCAVSMALQKKGIVLKPFVIGVGKDFSQAFDCVGTYFDASNEAAFKNVLSIVISQALNSTTAQVNLLDAYEQAIETNVNMTFYDNFSGQVRYNYVHTLNQKGVPDTLLIDPLSTYDIVVHTIPSVRKDSVTLLAGKHNIIPIKTPQGLLQIKLSGVSSTANRNNVASIIRKAQDMNTLHVQFSNETVKYLIGTYDIEILTLPRTYVNRVEISQDKTTTIEIPPPGIVALQKNNAGYGAIYLEKDNKLELITPLNENLMSESLLLQPGRYRAIFRSKYATKSIYTIDKPFTINSGESLIVKLY